MSSLYKHSSTSTFTNPPSDLSKDIPVTSAPSDSISDLSWSPAANHHLAVASWDTKVRVYDLAQNNSSEGGQPLIEFDGPVLSCDWSRNGQQIVGASTDHTARLLDLAVNGAPAQQVAAHDGPIRVVRFFEAPQSNAPMIVTGSWDKTVRYWDLRQATAVATLSCQERVYSMDVKDKLLVIGTADRYINIVNLNNPTTFHKTLESPLKHQTRVVSCFTGGFAVGGIEGRCAFQYVEGKDASSNFSFKCHRSAPTSNKTSVHAVNAISFHPIHGTFSTAGSDGTYHFWDKDAHHRLKGYPSVGGAITATGFNRDGTLFAYAVSYDWSMGFAENKVGYKNGVMLHPVDGEECKPRIAGVKKR
ncbi:Poly(A)+ RNA export protein rae1 [Schaereria dolodes]|nr:Poly(A)+ RNA export protein rae1 [Schaereria dolodes]